MSGIAYSMALDGAQAVSQYLSWPFHGFFELEGVTYAVGENGISVLGNDAADTTERSCQIRLPATDGGRSGESRLECVEFGGAFPAGGTLNIYCDGVFKGGFDIPPFDGHVTVWCSRDCFGRYLQLEILADDFELESIVAEAHELGRRRGR